MKIALSGLNPDKHKELIKSIQTAWPLYVSPVQNIFEETELEDEEKFEKLVEEMELNEDEALNFRGWYLLQQQYEKYKDQKYIIYNGSPIDLLCNALLLADAGLISEKYFEKIVYYNKKYLSPSNLDVVWWLPNPEGTEGLEDEDDKKFESIYNNLYDHYQTKFDTSPFFNKERCTAYLRFETLDYMDEVRMLIDSKGNLYSDNISNVDEERLKKALSRYPDLYQIWIDSQNSKLITK